MSNAPPRPPASLSNTPGRSMPSWLLAALLLPLGCGEDPLAFKAQHIKVAHDGFEVFDAHPVDLDHDGDMDIVVATENDLRYLHQEDLQWRDDTAGTGLADILPVGRLNRVGDDFLVERDGETRRLVYSGIGSWTEQAATQPPGDRATMNGAVAITTSVDQPPTILADLDGDGHDDRASIEGGRVQVALGDAAGSFLDVTVQVGADALRLSGDARRLHAVDIDGDGDLDLLVVAGRLFVLLNNGGSLEPVARGTTTREPDEGETGAHDTRPGQLRPWFVDGTAEAGLSCTHAEGDEQWDIRPTMGPGAAFADVDGDGDEDLFVVGGADQDSRLFLNDGSGHFEDGTERWQLSGSRHAGMGALFADWDDDGDPDLYLTCQGANVLWRNDGDHFTDVTDHSGSGDVRWAGSAATADIDRDGDLELFVTNYLEFDLSVLPPGSQDSTRRREDPIAMLPYVFAGQANVLYRNDGGLRFTDVTEPAGLHNPDGKSLGAVFLDHDKDGWPDLYVANDTTPNTFFRNLGDGSFEELSLFVGLDDPRGGMGLACIDIDADGDEDIALTNWQLEPNALYRNNHVHGETARRFMPAFEDIAVRAGLAQASVGYVGWGCSFADFDGDGDDDLFVANGYTSPDYETTMTCVGQTDQLFENVSGPGPFPRHRDMPRWKLLAASSAGPHFERELASRATALADVDGDGDLDLIVTANNGPLVHLVNQGLVRSLRVIPEGRPPAVSRDAVGAEVSVLLSDGRRSVAVVHAGSGYLGQNERGVRFTLGSSEVRSVDIVWPDGSRSTHPGEAAGTIRIVQPDS